MELEKGDITARSVVDQLIKNMEEYANYGFAFMLEKLDDNPGYFYNNEAFLNIFTSLIPKHKEDKATWSSDELPDDLESDDSTTDENKSIDNLATDDEADAL
jgi:hypothetical protein